MSWASMVAAAMSNQTKDIRWREEYTIRSSEVDTDQKATPLAILHLVQEASMGSASDLGASVAELEPQNLAWVLLRKSFTIVCLLYTSPSPRDLSTSRMPSSA